MRRQLRQQLAQRLVLLLHERPQLFVLGSAAACCGKSIARALQLRLQRRVLRRRRGAASAQLCCGDHLQNGDAIRCCGRFRLGGGGAPLREQRLLACVVLRRQLCLGSVCALALLSRLSARLV